MTSFQGRASERGQQLQPGLEPVRAEPANDGRPAAAHQGPGAEASSRDADHQPRRQHGQARITLPRASGRAPVASGAEHPRGEVPAEADPQLLRDSAPAASAARVQAKES